MRRHVHHEGVSAPGGLFMGVTGASTASSATPIEYNSTAVRAWTSS